MKRDRVLIGERAWALCSAGHLVHHRLVYPAMVHALIDYVRQPAGARGLVEDALRAIIWRPHQAHYSAEDGPLDSVPYVQYHG